MQNINSDVINEIKSVMQDCNINFLIGSGLSSPYLSLLGETERLLTELSHKKENEEIEKDLEKIIRASLYKGFFDSVISKNIHVLELSNKNEVLNSTLESYKTFVKLINTILLKRKSSILSRQVNLFTTNFDIFLEKSMEVIGVEYNDGFSGHFNPVFNLSNFKKSFFKRSLHYDNTYELPVFNLMKIHGSLTWIKEVNKENIYFDKFLRIARKTRLIDISNNQLIDVSAIFKQKIKEGRKIKIDDLIPYAKNKILNKNIKKFIEEYEKLSIINPTNEKFKETILNRNHYELLRIYSTELEKENTVLFVMGFSFSDEHIRDLTVRVANSNPTLKIYIFSYTEKSKNNIEEHINKSKPNNDNIKYISPSELKDEFKNDFQQKNQNNFSDKSDNKIQKSVEIKLDLETINKKIFENILRSIDSEGYNE